MAQKSGQKVKVLSYGDYITRKRASQMPRVNLNKTERESRRFSDYVRGQLARTRTNQGALADYLGITQQGLSLRMIGKISWKLPEVIDVCDYFGESYTIGTNK